MGSPVTLNAQGGFTTTFPAPSVPGTYVIRTDYTPTGALDPPIRRSLKHLRVTHFVPEPMPPQLVFPVIASQKVGPMPQITHNMQDFRWKLALVFATCFKLYHKLFLWPASLQGAASVRLHCKSYVGCLAWICFSLTCSLLNTNAAAPMASSHRPPPESF